MSRAWKFGDDVNTDVIIPGRYNITTDPVELGSKAFCEVRPEFAERVEPGDVVVAGSNFGCGSSREHAPIALKGAGVSAVIARSFARIFFRNAVNVGLPVLVCDDADGIADGARLEVDPAAGLVVSSADGRRFRTEPLPPFVLRIVEAGGIIPFVRANPLEAL